LCCRKKKPDNKIDDNMEFDERKNDIEAALPATQLRVNNPRESPRD
jgi:hypothetical protein